METRQDLYNLYEFNNNIVWKIVAKIISQQDTVVK